MFNENDLIVVEQMRAEKIRNNEKGHAERKVELRQDLQELVDTLQANFDQIAGISVVVIPKADSAMVRMRDEQLVACDGLSMLKGLDEAYVRIIRTHLQEQLRPRNPFAAMLGE